MPRPILSQPKVGCYTLSPANTGMSRIMLSYIMRHNFKVPASYLDSLTTYKLLYWQGHHILANAREGILMRDNIPFTVIYHGSCTRGSILSNPDHQYALSFRAANEEFNLPAAVLVSFS